MTARARSLIAAATQQQLGKGLVEHLHRNARWRPVALAAAAFDRAQFEGDRHALQSCLADEVTFISSDGVVRDREAFIQLFSDPLLRLDPFEVTDFRLIPFSASVAAVSGVTTFKGTDASGPFSQCFRYSDIFVRKNGAWRASFVQVTPLTAAAANSESTGREK